MNDVKDYLDVRKPTIQKAKECVKYWREWKRIVGSEVDDAQ